MTDPDQHLNHTPEPPRGITSQQTYLIVLVAACALGSVAYKLFRHQQLGHSAAMFVGLPAILAIVLALTPRAKSVTGGIVKGITLALLIVAPLLGEGFLCILMAAPLFYLVGILVGVIVDWHRRKRALTLSCVSILLLPMCLEGVTPRLTFNRGQSVEVTRIVRAPSALVEQSLARSPIVSLPLPAPLNIGFPRPLSASGGGLSVGDTRTIHFAGAEGAPPGDLILRVAEAGPGFVRFQAVSDHTKLAQWLLWTGSDVEWHPLDPTHTAVTWRIRFERQLDPAWYFTPFERAAVQRAAAFLIAANATPSQPLPAVAP